MTEEAAAIHGLECAKETSSSKAASKSRYRNLLQVSRQLPRPSDARLKESLNDIPYDIGQLRNSSFQKEKTYLYLGYGSNMCAETFLDRRGIRPLAQVNVVAPSIQLTFDLPGVPYTEPCFGNIRHCNLGDKHAQKEEKGSLTTSDYHKDRWHKGLVGVVYEVTASDFAHILATEGGGASYQDVLVDCYTLSSDPSLPVPINPTGTPLKAHTLFDPGHKARSDSSYAQPSARYLKLITDGGEEHDLPTEYRAYLSQIRAYTASSTRQQLGRFVFLAVWGPLLLWMFSGGGKMFLRPDGTYPQWYARLILAFFAGMWTSYDLFFKPVFADGERSVDDNKSAADRIDITQNAGDVEHWNENTPLLKKAEDKEEWNEPGTGYGDEMV